MKTHNKFNEKHFGINTQNVTFTKHPQLGFQHVIVMLFNLYLNMTLNLFITNSNRVHALGIT